jgi:hypothetical protein
MSERDILIRALRASGSEREAQLAEAILPAPPAEPTPPSVAASAAPEVEAPAAGPQPPAGEAPLQTVEDWEALGQKEQLARMDEVDVLLRQGQR